MCIYIYMCVCVTTALVGTPAAALAAAAAIRNSSVTATMRTEMWPRSGNRKAHATDVCKFGGARPWW